jgi:hypothetical protein
LAEIVEPCKVTLRTCKRARRVRESVREPEGLQSVR